MPRRCSSPPASGAAGQGSTPCAGSPISVATSTSPGATTVPGARHSRTVDRLIAAFPPTSPIPAAQSNDPVSECAEGVTRRAALLAVAGTGWPGRRPYLTISVGIIYLRGGGYRGECFLRLV